MYVNRGMINMRKLLTILEEAEGETPTHRFLSAVYRQTSPHPFMRGTRIHDNDAIIEVQPDVDDRNDTVSIDNIMALDAGQRLGQGRAALIFLLGLADECGVKLTLSPVAYAKGPNVESMPKATDLKAWYAHYGFRPWRRRMRRMPGTPIPAPRSPAA